MTWPCPFFPAFLGHKHRDPGTLTGKCQSCCMVSYVERLGAVSGLGVRSASGIGAFTKALVENENRQKRAIMNPAYFGCKKLSKISLYAHCLNFFYISAKIWCNCRHEKKRQIPLFKLCSV